MAADIITFPTHVLNSDGDDLELVISFEIDGQASDDNIDAADLSLIVLDYGEPSVEFNFDDPVIMPSQIEITISDIEMELFDYFFLNEDAAKNALVEINLNSSLDFSGNVIEDSIEFDYSNRVVTFSVSPPTDKIKDQPIWNNDETTPTWQDPFSDYPLYQPSGAWCFKMWFYLNKIFKIGTGQNYAESDIIIKHSWDYRTSGTPATVGLADLYWYHQLLTFFSQQWGVNSLVEFLDYLAFNTNSMIGMLNVDTPFLVQLYRYDGTDLQTLNKVQSHIVAYEHGIKNYFRLENFSNFTVNRTWTAGNLNFSDDKSDRKTVMDMFIENTIGGGVWTCYFFGTSLGTNPSTILTSDGTTLNITGVRNPDTDGTTWTADSGKMTADQQYYFRSDPANTIIHRITAEGIDYDFFKNFTLNGYKFQIIGWKKKYTQNLTEFKCINLGAVT